MAAESNSAVEDATNVVESTQAQEIGQEVEVKDSKKQKKNKQRRKKKKKSNNIENAQVTNDTAKNGKDKTSDVEDSEKVEIESPITNLRNNQR
ncbi:hypothetical protein RCL_jg5222.t1 [Rhizophagus clarus]|uniref:Uncharacterized protein n=1 Tax=Rhizophagus clarus TaxID=94130 RepID=A0A8H3LM63_9GLOM|nr:hypothetical protein RCL_jg5222.t1 [Rhizophagus clarus]